MPSLSFEPVNFTVVGSSSYGGSPDGNTMLPGDFNGDGLVDIANDSTADTSIVWLNAGAGRFWGREVNRPQPDLVPGQDYSIHRTAILDFDGDGRDDLVETRETAPDTNGFQFISTQALIPNGTVTTLNGRPFQFFFHDPVHNEDIQTSFRVAADFDGDGTRDLLRDGAIFYGRGNNLLLSRVVDGVGNVTRVHYDEAGAYSTTDPGCKDNVWPERCLPRMTGLVSSHEEGFVGLIGTGDPSDPSNDTIERTYSYHYVNARMNVTGHGWLGFDQRTVTRTATGQDTAHEEIIDYVPPARYVVDQCATTGERLCSQTTSIAPGYLYPLAGLPLTTTVIESPGPTTPHPLQAQAFPRVTITRNHWAVKLSADSRPFPFIQTREVATYDGFPGEGNIFAQLTEVNDSITVDGYGNETGRSRSTLLFGDRNPTDTSESTSRTFTPDRINWLISNPDTFDVSSTPAPLADGSGPSQPASQHWAFTYLNGALATVIRAGFGTSQVPLDQQRRTTYDRDEFGNVRHVTEEVMTGEPPRMTTITYDAENIYPATITNPAGQTSQVQYDARWGTPTVTADPNHIIEQRQYDGFGRLVETSNAVGTTIATYSAFSLAEGGAPVNNPAVEVLIERQGTAGTHGGFVKTLYDSYGRLVQTRSEGFQGTEVFSEQSYDALGRLARRTLPHTSSVSGPPGDTYSYDHLNRLTRIDHSDGSAKQFQYASSPMLDGSFQEWFDLPYFGHDCSSSTTLPTFCFVDVTLAIDEEGKRNATLTDFAGRVVRSIDGDNIDNTVHASDYFYGAFGRLEQAKDNLGNKTRFAYDDFGRRTQFVDPDSGAASYTYNGYDDLRTSTSPGQVARSYEHDPLGRLIKITDPAGVTQWIYDVGDNAIGRISETVSPGTTANPQGQHVLYHYEPTQASNNRGLLAGIDYVLDGATYSTSFEHDDLGRNKIIHYPHQGSGDPIACQYQYDVSGALSSIQEIGSNTNRPIWQIEQSYQAHLLQKESFGNGAVTEYGYNSDRRWIETIQTTLGSENIQSIATPRFKNGLIFHRTMPTLDREYQYDAINRLSAVLDNAPTGIPLYTYDDIGNIRLRGERSIDYDPVRPHQVRTAGSNSYEYSSEGNVRTRSGQDIPGGNQTFNYTPFNLPSSITTGQTSTLFEYSSDEERVVRRDPDKTRYSVGDLYERLIDTGTGETLEEHFRVYAGARQIAEVVRVPDGDRTLFFHADALGTVDTVSDDGQNSAHQTFDPFGEPLDAQGSLGTRVGFTGHQHDADLGLVDMKGRMYDPLAGRFMTPDPILQAPYFSQGLNRYSYVLNDPVNNVDPSGFTMINGEQETALDLGALATEAGVVAGVLGSPIGLGVGFGGLNIAASLSGVFGDLPGSGSPAREIQVAPSAAPTSSVTTRESLQATGQEQGGVGPAQARGMGGRPGVGGGPPAGLDAAGRPRAPRPFRTPLDAALAALAEYNPKSIADNVEHIGAVYKEANGRYTYSLLATGTGETAGNTVRINWRLVRDDADLVGLWHTHGAFDSEIDAGNFQFSLEDRAVAQTGKELAGNQSTTDVFRMYLGTPSGSIGVFTPSNTAFPVLYEGPVTLPSP